MALILSIETSTRSCSVALHQSGKPLATIQFYIEKATSHILTVAIQQLIQNSGLQFADIDSIAVAKGPGSCTGLRIGVATAKGLCYSLQKPFIAVNTLEVMTADIRRFFASGEYLFCPMIDARRMEVFCAIYNRNLETVLPVQAKIIEENSFSEVLVKNKIVFFGDGSAKCKDKIEKQHNAIFIDSIFPSAHYLGELVWLRLQKSKFEEVEIFEPFYLKEFVSTKDLPQ